jgi:hypothetical protein
MNLKKRHTMENKKVSKFDLSFLGIIAVLLMILVAGFIVS